MMEVLFQKYVIIKYVGECIFHWSKSFCLNIFDVVFRVTSR